MQVAKRGGRGEANVKFICRPTWLAADALKPAVREAVFISHKVFYGNFEARVLFRNRV